ncbi:MAG: Tetratricopeptide 4, partial [Polaromonas sp.]|nr:Tetratricopeptide 4 [Polaromonas sp.]
MKLKPTLLALGLALSSLAAGAQQAPDTGGATGYRHFLLYPHLQRGAEAMARGDRAKALAEYERARALAPDNPAVALQLAQAYRRFNEPARAEAVLREQLRRDPGNARLSGALAELRGGAPQTAQLPAGPASPAPAQPAQPEAPVAPVAPVAPSKPAVAAVPPSPAFAPSA